MWVREHADTELIVVDDLLVDSLTVDGLMFGMEAAWEFSLLVAEAAQEVQLLQVEQGVRTAQVDMLPMPANPIDF